MAAKKRILIVDDEPDFVEAFRMTFEGKSYQVMTASSKAEAQERVSAHPDVIVLGTLAPAGQAFAVHQWLRKHPRHRGIPLMVVDARYSERSIRGWRKIEGMQLESDDYLTKPVEPAALAPRVAALLAEAIRRIKVLIADDHTMVRDGIRAVLALQKDIDVVAEAGNGQDAVEKVMRLTPTVALMDLMMPGMSGLEATKMISQRCPETKVLVLTQFDEEDNMVAARNMGAHGFIPKRAAGKELVAGVRTVDRGGFFPASFADTSAN